MEELTAIFRAELHRWDSTVIADCRRIPATGGSGNGHTAADDIGDGELDRMMRELDRTASEAVKVKLQCDPGELLPQLSYRFYGQWSEYTNKRNGKTERQFAARTFVEAQPHGRSGIVRYLCRAPHVGEAIAGRLWDRFHGDAVRILREDPEVAAAAAGSGLTVERAKQAAAFLTDKAALESCSIELIDLLSGRGFPKETAKRIIGEWGNRGPTLVKKNPYLLMRFRGCGFLRTDATYLDLGGNPAAIKRQALAAWHGLASDNNGHTWHPERTAIQAIRARVAGTEVNPPKAINLGIRSKLLAGKLEPSGYWLAERRKADHEAEVAEIVRRMRTATAAWPAIADLDVSEHQREQLGKAISGGSLAIFGGGPGTGKTRTAARLIGRLLDRDGTDAVAICAPTGKAAVRMAEVLVGYGVKHPVRTIHSLLKVESNTAGDGWSFAHHAGNPLPHRWIVVDESSMIDCDLAASLLRAVAVGAGVLLIGDTGQLPPVGHGAPLRDLIAAGCPYGELLEIWRNSGLIVQACAAIRDARPFVCTDKLDLVAGNNLLLKQCPHAAASAAAIVETIHRLKAKGVDVFRDCQVIVAVNHKSALSRKELNAVLQRELNPAGQAEAGSPFRAGDKVVCLKNGFYPSVSDGGDKDAEVVFDEESRVYVANGELGRTVECRANKMIVSLEAPRRRILVPRGKVQADASKADGEDDTTDTGCSWDLGYALSCHKSQGSEWPWVMVALDEHPGAKMVCSREWLYTAISRGKTATVLYGKLATAYAMIGRPAIRLRKTFLRELIERKGP